MHTNASHSSTAGVMQLGKVLHNLSLTLADVISQTTCAPANQVKCKFISKFIRETWNFFLANRGGIYAHANTSWGIYVNTS